MEMVQHVGDKPLGVVDVVGDAHGEPERLVPEEDSDETDCGEESEEESEEGSEEGSDETDDEESENTTGLMSWAPPGKRSLMIVWTFTYTMSSSPRTYARE